MIFIFLDSSPGRKVWLKAPVSCGRTGQTEKTSSAKKTRREMIGEEDDDGILEAIFVSFCFGSLFPFLFQTCLVLQKLYKKQEDYIAIGAYHTSHQSQSGHGNPLHCCTISDAIL
nr:hypothetical protein Itr_chr08CG03850 [Ipomoea trifida]